MGQRCQSPRHAPTQGGNGCHSLLLGLAPHVAAREERAAGSEPVLLDLLARPGPSRSAQGGGEQAKLLPIFGDRAAGYRDTPRIEQLGHALIAQGARFLAQ